MDTEKYNIENYGKMKVKEIIENLEIGHSRFYQILNDMRDEGLLPQKQLSGVKRRIIQSRKFLEVGKTYKFKGYLGDKAKVTIGTMKVLEEYDNYYLCEDERGFRECILKVDLFTEEVKII